MKKALTKIKNTLYLCEGGEMIGGADPNMRDGGFYLSGNLDGRAITDQERVAGVEVNDLIKE